LVEKWEEKVENTAGKEEKWGRPIRGETSFFFFFS